MIKYILIILFIASVDCFSTEKSRLTLSQQEDSLSNLLSNALPATKKAEILKELSLLTLDSPNGNIWLERLLKEARQFDMLDKEDWAIRNLTRYYFNQNNTDSVVYYAALSDSIAKHRRVYSDEYYDTQTFLCQSYLWSDELEKAANLAIHLYNLAHEEKNENGTICSCETLGLINQRIGNDSTALEFLTEGLNLQLKQEGGYRYVIQLLNSIIESNIRLNHFADAHIRLEELEDLLKQIEHGDIESDPAFPFQSITQLKDAYYINLYVRQKRMKEAKQYIDRLSVYGGKMEYAYIDMLYHLGLAEYYRQMRDYQTSLNEMDIVLKIDLDPMMMKLKADILYEAGKAVDAALLYKKTLEKTQEMNSQAFVRQLSQLHSLYNMNHLELQIKELHLKELELGAKQQQLKWTMIITGILIFVLVFGAIVYLHTRKLKNQLQNERHALLNSERALRIALDRAEESDRVKSLFLSNMSHEIRTPLNAISGFAQLLEAETEEGDERREYTHVITDNATFLLNLVNDILDISRLESEKYRFSFASENLADCCRSAIISVEHRIKKGVRLLFKPEDETFLLRTDKLRLRQVLINLVGNAAKFTEEGYIELAYTIDYEGGFVRFTVTDTGCGIPEDKQDAVFERFEKLNECVQGTGLGLSICRIIAERFKGEVLLDKEYTGGARFIFIHSLNL